MGNNLQEVSIYPNVLNPLWVTSVCTSFITVSHALAWSNAWISSSVLPLVSGTSFATNKIVTRLAAENKKNVPAYRKYPTITYSHQPNRYTLQLRINTFVAKSSANENISFQIVLFTCGVPIHKEVE